MWKIEDEWIDLAAAEHRVLFRNADTQQKHFLINYFNLKTCPTCGHPQVTAQSAPEDFQKLKDAVLAKLQSHHKAMMLYRGMHPNARIATGNK